MTVRALWHTVVVEARLFLREPAALFFTLAFPVLLLVLNAEGGNEPVPEFGGELRYNVLIPGLLGLVMATMPVMGLAENVAQHRDWGVLRRLRATPVRPWVILGARGAVATSVTVAGAVVLVGVAVMGYKIETPAAPTAAAVAFGLGTLTFVALGFLLAALPLSARGTQALAWVIFFPMIFLSGATWPPELLPELARRIGEFLPLTYAVEALRDAWTAGTWNGPALAVLAATAVVASALAARLFRWE
jgi:ABC-2 type transport system permease protein